MAVEPASVMPDMVELERETSPKLGEEDQVEPKETKEVKEDLEIEVEEEKAEKKGSERDLAAENAELQRQLFEIGEQVKEIKATKAEPEEKKKGKTAKPSGETELSEEQLLGIMEEHKDDPRVLFQVFKHMAGSEAQRVATGIRDETMRDVEYQTWHRDLKSKSDGIMGPEYEKDVKLRPMVNDTAARLGLDKHPMGELFAHLLIQYARGKQGKTNEAAEAERVKEITTKKGLDKTRGASDKGAKGKALLSAEQIKVADKLGVSHASYAKFLPKES